MYSLKNLQINSVFKLLETLYNLSANSEPLFLPCQMTKMRVCRTAYHFTVDRFELFNALTEGNNLSGTDEGTEIK